MIRARYRGWAVIFRAATGPRVSSRAPAIQPRPAEQWHRRPALRRLEPVTVAARSLLDQALSLEYVEAIVYLKQRREGDGEPSRPRSMLSSIASADPLAHDRDRPSTWHHDRHVARAGATRAPSSMASAVVGLGGRSGNWRRAGPAHRSRVHPQPPRLRRKSPIVRPPPTPMPTSLSRRGPSPSSRGPRSADESTTRTTTRLQVHGYVAGAGVLRSPAHIPDPRVTTTSMFCEQTLFGSG